MILFGGAFAVVAFVVWLFVIVDVITTPADQVRNLPKLLWLVLVVLLADVGAIAWLVAGRPWTQRPLFGSPSDAQRVPAGRPLSPDDDDEFLAGLSARAEEQRRRAREAAERAAREDEERGGPAPA